MTTKENFNVTSQVAINWKCLPLQFCLCLKLMGWTGILCNANFVFSVSLNVCLFIFRFFFSPLSLFYHLTQSLDSCFL